MRLECSIEGAHEIMYRRNIDRSRTRFVQGLVGVVRCPIQSNALMYYYAGVGEVQRVSGDEQEPSGAHRHPEERKSGV